MRGGGDCLVLLSFVSRGPGGGAALALHWAGLAPLLARPGQAADGARPQLSKGLI